MIPIHIFAFSAGFMLLLLYTPRLSHGVICYHTAGPNLTTCEISPEQSQVCRIECEQPSASQNGIICLKDCVNSLICHNQTTENFLSLCCTTSYCNVFTEFLTTSNTPSPTTTSNDDNNDVTTDNTTLSTHIIIAVCLGVVFILAVMTLVIAIILCHWRRWSRNQLRWSNIIN